MDLRAKPRCVSRGGLGRTVNRTGRVESTAARAAGWKIGSDVTRPENSGKDPACRGPGGGSHCAAPHGGDGEKDSEEADRYGSDGGVQYPESDDRESDLPGATGGGALRIVGGSGRDREAERGGPA